jgi:hypothetical protein
MQRTKHPSRPLDNRGDDIPILLCGNFVVRADGMTHPH